MVYENDELTPYIVFYDSIMIDLDSKANQENELFVLDDVDFFSFRPRYNSSFILDILQPLDYEVKKEWLISIGCRRKVEPAFSLLDEFDRRQLQQILIRVNDVNDNPPKFTSKFIERGILSSEAPNNGRSLITLRNLC